MHDARATPSRRSRLVLGAAFLLALLLLSWLSIGPRMHSPAPALETAGMAPSSLPPPQAADMARRAAIAALGPLNHKGVNAADLYADAIALYARLTPEEKAALKNRSKKIDPALAAALYAKLQPIMDLLRRARNADYVDWNMGPLTPATSMTGRIDQAGALGGVALWESNYRFQSDPDGAASDLAALVALGRAECDTILGLALENGFRTSAIALIAQNAGSLSTASASDIADIVSPSGAQQSFQAAMNGEITMFQSALARYSNPATPVPVEGQNTITNAQFVATIQFVEQSDQALGSANLEPPAQFQPWWNQQLAAAASLPYATLTLNAQQQVISREQASLVQNAMLTAGIAFEQGDQPQFQSTVDPSTGQPFTVTQTPTGFQLTSPTQYKGAPVTLTFPAPAAQ